MDLPYKTEYAKTGRASCKGCKSPIAKDSLRLAVMVQSPMFDGKTPNWYHFMCFFGKQKPKTVDDIENFEVLRYEDQEKIKEKIQAGGSIVVPTKKGKKRDAETAGALKLFHIEYSKSGRAACRGCELKIMKDEIRISKKDFESDVGKRYGGQDMWHHVTCFAKIRSDLGYYESADKLPGYKALKKADQADVKKELPAIKQEDVPESKKAKKEEKQDTNPEEEEIKNQNKIMYKYRDSLDELTTAELKHLLEFNEQEIPTGKTEMMNRLSDYMAFGALKPCTVCSDGQFVYSKHGYVCSGDATEWSKCNTVVKEPKRRKFVVPKDVGEKYPFLGSYKYKKANRIIRDVVVPAAAKKEETDELDAKPRVEREKPPLYDMKFVLLKPAGDKDEMKRKITRMGGKVVTRIDETVMAVVSTADEVEKLGSRMLEAKDADVQVVPDGFVEKAAEYKGRIPELIVELSICDWGKDPKTRLPAEPSTSGKSKSRSMFTKSVPSKVKLTLKGGTAVDPDSGLAHKAHVYTSGKTKYTVVLSQTDIQSQKNSYYKLQLLQSDSGQGFWVFRSWGRIGTTIGSNKLEKVSTLNEGMRIFCDVYEERTGNLFEHRDSFVKVPGKYYPIDVEYGEDERDLGVIDTTVPSKLAPPVQDLIKFIFDVNSMKQVMLEFELDTEKMPLGKLSKKQIQSAYGVLTELQKLVEEKEPQARLIDASNRFYTFIPHSFGVENPPVIDDLEVVQKKREMLENLMELEIAYNLMKGSGGDQSLDAYYAQLKAEIDTLDRESEEFSIVQEYVQNTHAPTHDNYELDIVNVFKVQRQGEDKRHKPFKKLHNRKLLWHGSRKTNFAGILSQGLRIAPPEAPCTGYMFGKGIYFADMVTKSANYCCTDKMNNRGLMLLCEVALGEMLEKDRAFYVEKLPSGKHSCKGIGRTRPDPAVVKKLGDTEVPVGKPVTSSKVSGHLLYNEFIVYDIAQVKMKYLLQLDFKYKY